MRAFGFNAAGIGAKIWLGPNALNPSNVVVVKQFTFTGGGPNSNGPVVALTLTGFPYGQSNDLGAYGDGLTSIGSYGLLNGSNPGSFSINGAAINAIGITDTSPGVGQGFVLALTGSHARGFFNSLVLGAPFSTTLTTAAANFFGVSTGGGTFSVWGWNNATASFFTTCNASYT